jgi:hypothetical protein
VFHAPQIHMLLTFVDSKLIDYVDSGDVFLWHGLTYAFTFVCLNITRGMLSQQHCYGKYVTGIRVRSALTAAVYRKVSHLKIHINHTIIKYIVCIYIYHISIVVVKEILGL